MNGTANPFAGFTEQLREAGSTYMSEELTGRAALVTVLLEA